MHRVLVPAISAAILLAAGWAWLAFFPALPVDLGGVESLDPKAEKVRIPVGSDDAVEGWYVRGSEPAAVLLLHGHGRNHQRMWRYGHFLSRAGYAVLAIDFRSAREHRRLPTTLGHHELSDAQAALDWLRARPDLDGHAIGVFGESLGGSVAIRLAAANPDVGAVVDDSGFSTGAEAIADFFRGVWLPAWPATPLARRLGIVVTGHDPGAHDVLAAAATLRERPLLFIHCMSDRRISPEQSRAVWRAAGEKDTLLLLPGGHNEGWKKSQARYEAAVTTFLDEHLLLAWARANARRATGGR
ncbi:MAG TPA: alpha/beta fold hydrolase [Candidatus Limnocylindria bacterium]|nr:alpha/beta fold hydrolase [Candidatus Limnocylindria bacterium]